MIDDLVLNFNKANVVYINITLAFIMFGIALNLTIENFKFVFRTPRKLILGLLSQLVLLPVFTFLLILIAKPSPSIALGMILVASCPGGNISNFISSLAKANVELSISLTSITSVASILFTPLNFLFYGNLYPPAQKILREITLDWLEVFQTIGIIIIIPILLGMLTKKHFNLLALKLFKPMEVGSMIMFLLIVIAAFVANVDNFLACISVVFFLVLFHNGGALLIGYWTAKLGNLPYKDRKSLSIETGIQNSGLGLLLIFTFFEGLGGMAIVTAWWAIWHIISGFTIALLWRKY